jgi:hypothetical protein
MGATCGSAAIPTLFRLNARSLWRGVLNKIESRDLFTPTPKRLSHSTSERRQSALHRVPHSLHTDAIVLMTNPVPDPANIAPRNTGAASLMTSNLRSTAATVFESQTNSSKLISAIKLSIASMLA